MKKTGIIFALLFAMMMSWSAAAQISVTEATGQNVKSFLRTHFLGSSVQLDTLHGHTATFNGQETIASNQIGTFTNADTGLNHMPIGQGIVLAACAGGGSGTASPASDGDSIAPDLYAFYNDNGGTMSMNDVASLEFYVRPSGDNMSFSYCFASDEYPNYVCSQFNDVFGLFLTGPYDRETGELVSVSGLPSYSHTDIAVVPGTETPVMINTVNGGSAVGSATPCILTNTQYFVSNDVSGCPFNGCTVELLTRELSVSPDYTYRLELAVCNISDHVLPSAVYLRAHSLNSACDASCLSAAADADYCVMAGSHCVTVSGAAGQTVKVFDVQGRCIRSLRASSDRETIDLPLSGAYFIRIAGNKAEKTVVAE